MSAWTDFRNKVEDRIGVGDTTAATDASQNPQGGLFEAIYQFGRGQADTAVQKLTQAFRATSAGKKIEAEATRQKVSELMPYIVLGIVVLIAGSYFAFRK